MISCFVFLVEVFALILIRSSFLIAQMYTPEAKKDVTSEDEFIIIALPLTNQNNVTNVTSVAITT